MSIWGKTVDAWLTSKGLGSSQKLTADEKTHQLLYVVIVLLVCLILVSLARGA